jgi:hypothetical protein
MCDTYVRHLPLTDNVFHVSGDGQRFRIAISPQQGFMDTLSAQTLPNRSEQDRIEPHKMTRRKIASACNCK